MFPMQVHSKKTHFMLLFVHFRDDLMTKEHKLVQRDTEESMLQRCNFACSCSLS